MSLTIVSVVEDNSHQLADLMIKSVNHFTMVKHEILIIDNSGTNQSLSQYPNVRVIDNTKAVKGLIGGSNRHGCGLNSGMRFVETEWTAILDSDVVLLGGNWFCDNFDIGDAIKENGNAHTCFLWRNTASLKKVDWSPGHPPYSAISYPSERDVGWRYEINSLIQSYKLIDCKEDGCYFYGLQCDEIWDFNNNLVATHFGRGSNLKGKADKGFGSHQEQLAKWKAIIKELTGLE